MCRSRPAHQHEWHDRFLRQRLSFTKKETNTRSTKNVWNNVCVLLGVRQSSGTRRRSECLERNTFPVLVADLIVSSNVLLAARFPLVYVRERLLRYPCLLVSCPSCVALFVPSAKHTWSQASARANYALAPVASNQSRRPQFLCGIIALKTAGSTSLSSTGTSTYW